MLNKGRKDMKKILIPLLFGGFIVSVTFANEPPERTGKSGFGKSGKLGGPSSTSAQLEEDDELKKAVFRFPEFDSALQPWFDFKGRLNERYGLQLGAAYTALYQIVDDAPSGTEDDAGVGIARIFGRWTLLGRDTDNHGSLVFSVDNRHRLGTDATPSGLGFNIGYNGIPGTLFSDVDTVLVDLNWQQAFNDGRSGFVVGRYDPSDFMDVLGYANPWTTFQNLSILFNTSIALHDSSAGFGMGHYFSDQWFGLVTVNDGNGNVSDVGAFEEGAEFFTQAEIGWTPSKDQRYFRNIHVTGWHTDSRDKMSVEESRGLTFAANWTSEDKLWMPFVRYGWSEGSAPLMNDTATIGLLNYIAHRSDLVGIGANWGNPSDPSLRHQYTGELFYRVQLAQNLAITPSVQLLVNPALNPNENNLVVLGLRTRMSF